jgi:hypothetical protein
MGWGREGKGRKFAAERRIRVTKAEYRVWSIEYRAMAVGEMLAW